MSDRPWRPPPLRLLVGAALLVLAIAEAQSMVVSLRAHTRLREAAAEQARRSLVAGLPHLAALAAPQTGGSFAVAARSAVEQLGASELQLFDLLGTSVHADPIPSPVQHWPPADHLRRLRGGEVLSYGPLHGSGTRVLAYAFLPSDDRPLVLRLGVAVPEVVEDLRERDRLFLMQGLALVLLLVTAAVAFVPGRGKESVPSHGALDAYEAAMGRLRVREEEMSRVHDEERQTLARRMREKDALARAGELTAGIAHEVRNGLGTILGYARLIERSPPAAETAAAARSIREECETLEVVVRHFVDYVRDERLMLVTFDLHRMVSRVVAREQREGEAAVAPLGGEGPQTVVGDEDMLERAVENLVRNARQAAGPGGHVHVVLERAGQVVRIRVSDDGPGLPAEFRDGIRPFFTTKPGGLGLGLPTVQKIVNLHGGELTFAPVIPRGTSVIISLPGPAVPA